MKKSILILILIIASLISEVYMDCNVIFADNNANDYLMLKKRISIFGSRISNLNINDINEDGTLDIICSGTVPNLSHEYANNFWYVLAYSQTENRYKQKFVSDFYPNETPSSHIVKILIRDVDKNGSNEIVVALENGDIEIYNAPELTKVRVVKTGVRYVCDFAIEDIDNDGVCEFILSDFSRLTIISALDYTIEWYLPYGGSFNIANVDNDSALEIVIGYESNYRRGYVIDGVTQAIEWQFEAFYGFGNVLKLADIDNDGRSEIVTRYGEDYIRAYDADTKTIKWNKRLPYTADPVSVVDLNKDGVYEILLTLTDRIGCYDIETLSQVWSIRNPEGGVSCIDFADVDNDGADELIWGAGSADSGPDYLCIADLTTLTIEWQSLCESGPFWAFDVYDVDNDREKEIVSCSYETDFGFKNGIISIYNANNLLLEWQSQPVDYPTTISFYGVLDLKIANVDTDSAKEIIIATDHLYNGVLLVYDGITHELEWKTPNPYIYDGMPFSSVEAYDIDGNGIKEIIASNTKATSAAEGGFIFAFDVLSGLEKWRSIDLKDSTFSLKISDLDNNGQTEVIAVPGQGWFGSIYVLDIVNGSVIKTISEKLYDCIDISDFNNDGIKDIIAGTIDGEIVIYSGNNYTEIYNEIVSDERINGIKIISAGQSDKVAFTSDEYAYIYDLVNKRVICSSPNLSPYLFDVMWEDINNDNINELVLGSSYAIHIYESNAQPVLAPIGNKETNEGELLEFTISATDPDVNNTLTYTASNLPEGANFDPEIKTFTWIPDYDQARIYTDIKFTVSDGSLTDDESIIITVNNTNRVPILDPIRNKEVNENELLQFTISATDPDGDLIIYSAENLPPGAYFNAQTRQFSWTPNYDQAGNYQVTFTASDGNLYHSETITITVNNVNRPPVFGPLTDQRVKEGRLLQFKATATDPDNDPLKFWAENLPRGSTFEDNLFSWRPYYDQVGSYKVTFKVSDKEATVTKTITITVFANPVSYIHRIIPSTVPSGGRISIMGFNFLYYGTDSKVLFYNHKIRSHSPQILFWNNYYIRCTVPTLPDGYYYVKVINRRGASNPLRIRIRNFNR